MNEEIITNKRSALVVLNETLQEPGKETLIYYYDQDGNVDFLYAIGKGIGIGPDFYSMIQEHEEIPVIMIRQHPLDVSRFVHGESGLGYDSGRWYRFWAADDNRQPSELTEPAIYRNLEDGFRWFFSNGVLKREDDFLTSGETNDLIEQNIECIQEPILLVNLEVPENTAKDGENYYLPGNVESVEMPKFTVQILNYKGEDETSKYTISLESGETLDYIDGKYVVYANYDADFTLPIVASRGLVHTSRVLKVWFPEIAWYGSFTYDSGDVVLDTLQSTVVYHNLQSLELEYDLDSSNSILLIPTEFAKFKHIYDDNRLDYLENYDYDPGFEYNGTIYSAYLKKDPTEIEDFKQIFTYDYIPSGGDEGEEYYTKEEIDQMIYSIGADLINDNVVSTNKTWSSNKLNLVYTWAINKMNSEIGEKFVLSTISTGQTYYTDEATQTTMTVEVRSKFDGILVNCDSTPAGWTPISTGVYSKTTTGINGTTLLGQDFSYTKDGLTITKTSDSKTIRAINPAYYGLVVGNDGSSAVIPSQTVEGMTRVIMNKNNTETIDNNTQETRYLWILTKNTAEATQGGLSILETPLEGKEFVLNGLTLSGYKLYISTNPVSPGYSFTNVNIIIKL